MMAEAADDHLEPTHPPGGADAAAAVVEPAAEHETAAETAAAAEGASHREAERNEKTCFRGESKPVVMRPVVRWTDAGAEDAEDALAVEEPLEIRLEGSALAVTMRTPGADDDLAVGFAVTEGIVRSPADFQDVAAPCKREGRNRIALVLRPELLTGVEREAASAQRSLFMSSSCGVCGKRTIENLLVRLPTATRRFVVSRSVLASLPERMRAAQATFDRTGGLHAAAVFTPQGELLVLREDVGRHNAVDKAIGAIFRTGRFPIDPAVLLVSGRTSFELLQKAAMAGIGVLAAVSAPSSLAVDFARRCDVTLVGFLRPGRMNVYHDGRRLDFES